MRAWGETPGRDGSLSPEGGVGSAACGPMLRGVGQGLGTDDRTLAILETHPIQYHVPVYRRLQERFGIPVRVIYGSDYVSWATGIESSELSSPGTSIYWRGMRPCSCPERGTGPGAQATEGPSARGLGRALREAAPAAALVVGLPSLVSPGGVLACTPCRATDTLPRGDYGPCCCYRGRTKAWIRDSALRWLYRRCDALLYVGSHSLDHFQRLGCEEERLFFSPYCVDGATFDCGEVRRAGLRAKARQRWGLAESDLVFLFSGKLVPRKGPELLIQAVRELPAGVRENVVVGWIGDGELREALEALARRRPTGQGAVLRFPEPERAQPLLPCGGLAGPA